MMSNRLPRYKELLGNSDAADATISDPLDLSVPTAVEAPIAAVSTPISTHK